MTLEVLSIGQFDGVLTSRYARCQYTISCPIDKTSRVIHNTYSLRVLEVALITPPTTFKVSGRVLILYFENFKFRISRF